MIVFCFAALTSLSNSVSYMTFLFLEWRITLCKTCITQKRKYEKTILSVDFQMYFKFGHK